MYNPQNYTQSMNYAAAIFAEFANQPQPSVEAIVELPPVVEHAVPFGANAIRNFSQSKNNDPTLPRYYLTVEYHEIINPEHPRSILGYEIKITDKN